MKRNSRIAPPNPGFYPGYHILSQSAFWDEATRKVVHKRLDPPGPLRFFTQDEGDQLAAVCARMLPQDDRDPQFRIPIVPVIDERLAAGRLDGFRYADMPPDGEAHRLGLEAIHQIAIFLHRVSFMALLANQQEEVLLTLHDGRPPAGHRIWQRMNVVRYWTFLLNDIVTAYYQHPWAWDEIGFGGPAYPRGYTRLNAGDPEPWECPERRHPWQPPPHALSANFSPLAEPGPCRPRPLPRSQDPHP